MAEIRQKENYNSHNYNQSENNFVLKEIILLSFFNQVQSGLFKYYS